MNDPIGDFLIRIKNAAMAGKTAFVVPYSKLKEELAKILIAEQFLSKSEVITENEKKNLSVSLFLKDNKVTRIEAKRISKPGRKVYIKAKDIRKLRGLETTIVSTSQGLMTAKNALKKNLGGELICKIIKNV